MDLISKLVKKLAVVLTSEMVTPVKGNNAFPLDAQRLKPSLDSDEVPLALDESGRTLTFEQVEKLSCRFSKLTRKQYRALPASTRNKYRAIIRSHYYYLFKKEPAWIYVIHNKAWPNFCKIGVTQDVKYRLQTYNVYAPKSDFVCMRAEYFEDENRYISEMYAEFADQRSTGEWFEVEPYVACEYLAKLKAESDVV